MSLNGAHVCLLAVLYVVIDNQWFPSAFQSTVLFCWLTRCISDWLGCLHEEERMRWDRFFCHLSVSWISRKLWSDFHEISERVLPGIGGDAQNWRSCTPLVFAALYRAESTEDIQALLTLFYDSLNCVGIWKLCWPSIRLRRPGISELSHFCWILGNCAKIVLERGLPLAGTSRFLGLLKGYCL